MRGGGCGGDDDGGAGGDDDGGVGEVVLISFMLQVFSLQRVVMYLDSLLPFPPILGVCGCKGKVTPT